MILQYDDELSIFYEMSYGKLQANLSGQRSESGNLATFTLSITSTKILGDELGSFIVVAKRLSKTSEKLVSRPPKWSQIFTYRGRQIWNCLIY